MNAGISENAGRSGQELASFWAQRTRRERVLLLSAVVLLLVAALLGLGILPAWRALQAAPQEKARLDAQWQRMRGLQAQSAALLRQPRREFSEAGLRASLAPLGQTAQLQVSDKSAELRLQGAQPEALARWLLSSRAEVGAVVREAQLQRVRLEGQNAQEGWSGRLVLDLAR